MAPTKEAVISRASPYTWKYELWYALVGQPRFIRHWIRQPPKSANWLVQVNNEIAALSYGLIQRGYIVTVKEHT